ncbi:MAG: WD40 repeat domain-containing protein, partial [Gemmataceae bacterium]
EFAEDLRRFVEGQPILARPEGYGRRVGRWAWRRRALIAVGVVALVAGLGVAVSVLLIKNAEVSAAEREARQGKADAEEALALKEEALYRLNVSLAWREWEAGNGQLARELLGDCPEPQRRWEWYHLDRLFHPEVAVIDVNEPASPSNPLNLQNPQVTFDGESARCAAVVGGGVCVLDARTGRRLASLRRPGHRHHRAALLPGGKVAVVSYAVEDGPPQQFATSLDVFGPDGGPPAALPLGRFATGLAAVDVLWHGGRLIACRHDGLLVWDRLDAAPRTVKVSGYGWAPHPDPDLLLASSAPAGRAATSTVNIVTGAAEVLVPALPGLSRPVMSADGNWLAGLDGNRRPALYLRTQGRWRTTLFGPGPGGIEPTAAVRFSPDSRYMAVGYPRKGQVAWVELGRASLVGHFNGIGDLKDLNVSPDGTRAATVAADGVLRLWDAGSLTDLPPAGRPPVTSLAFSPDGTTVAAFWSHGGEVIERATRRRLLAPALDPVPVGISIPSPGWFDEAGRLVWIAPGGRVRTYEVRGGRLADERPWAVSDPAPRSHCTPSPDGRHYAVHVAGQFGLYRLAGGPPAWQRPEEHFLHHVAFSPDGRFVATTSGGPSFALTVYRASDGEVLERRPSFAGSYFTTAFSPDAEWLAVGVSGGAVTLHRREGMEPRYVIPGGIPGSKVLVFSPDGGRLAVNRSRPDLTGLVMLFDAQTGRELLTLPTGRPVTALEYSPDGTCLAVGLSDGRLLLWEGGQRSSR